MISAPALIVFDLDGVLVDSEPLASQAVAEVLTACGHRITAADVAERFTGYTDCRIAALMAAETGRPLPEDFAARVEVRSLALFNAALRAMPGAAALLQGLDVPACVASNSGPRRIRRSLEVAGLADYLPEQRRFSAAQVAHPKPAPDLHLHAAAVLGAAPEASLVIEDSPTGIAAARAAGMTAFGFVGAGHVADRAGQADRLRTSGAAHIFADLAELPALLASL